MRLTRIPGDPALYGLEGVGTLRVIGRNWRAATVAARGLSWNITCRGIWQPVIQVAGPVGNVIGTFKRRRLRRGGSFAWSESQLTLRSDSRSPGYILSSGDRMLAKLERVTWDERSPNITVDECAEIDPELVLFTAFVVASQRRKPTRHRIPKRRLWISRTVRVRVRPDWRRRRVRNY
jgi:hypothetical protein